jgi:hypothetical protein
MMTIFDRFLTHHHASFSCWYDDSTQCMKFMSKTTMMTASWTDVQMASSQGSITTVVSPMGDTIVSTQSSASKMKSMSSREVTVSKNPMWMYVHLAMSSLLFSLCFMRYMVMKNGVERRLKTGYYGKQPLMEGDGLMISEEMSVEEKRKPKLPWPHLRRDGSPERAPRGKVVRRSLSPHKKMSPPERVSRSKEPPPPRSVSQPKRSALRSRDAGRSFPPEKKRVVGSRPPNDGNNLASTVRASRAEVVRRSSLPENQASARAIARRSVSPEKRASRPAGGMNNPRTSSPKRRVSRANVSTSPRRARQNDESWIQVSKQQQDETPPSPRRGHRRRSSPSPDEVLVGWDEPIVPAPRSRTARSPAKRRQPQKQNEEKEPGSNVHWGYTEYQDD